MTLLGEDSRRQSLVSPQHSFASFALSLFAGINHMLGPVSLPSKSSSLSVVLGTQAQPLTRSPCDLRHLLCKMGLLTDSSQGSK